MKDVCDKFSMPYETLRFYCNEGLIPNVKRDHNNYRSFDERDLAWIEGLQCLRKCGLGIKELKVYLDLAMQGSSTINKRKSMLDHQKVKLLEMKKEIDKSLAYIEQKNQYYADVQSGEVKYTSNLVDID
jgi:DNA-binding transcriptional MerR regulator